MIRRTSTILLVSLLIVAVLTMPAVGAVKKDKLDKRHIIGDLTARRAATYAIAGDENLLHNVRLNAAAPSSGGIPIGTMTTAGGSESPGVVVGNTWYDYQHNGSIGRMIGTGPHSGNTGPTVVHFAWMYAPDAEITWRSYAYAAYRTSDHSQLAPVWLPIDAPAGTAKGGYVNVDVTPDNRGIVGGHVDHTDPIGDSYLPTFYFDGGPAFATFPNMEQIPDSVAMWGVDGVGSNMCWPRMFFQLGTDTVMHVAAEESTASGYGPQAISYFRKVGFEGSVDSEWDYPPYVIDTTDVIAQDVVGQRNGDRVCLTWFAALPYDEPWCDTCSAYDSFYGNNLISQKDNDIYYQESYDQGATWLPRVNMTKSPIGGKAYKAYCDASTLYDSEGNLHIAWNAIPWAADTCMDVGGWCWAEDWNQFLNVRLMHWSENVPYIRPICDQTQAVSDLEDSCFANDFSVRIAKMSLAECNDKLYCIWTQFNNPKIGIIDDCAAWGYKASSENAANAEIYLSVSEDWGMTWDYQRNLTNTYTPRCDPKKEYDCQHDSYASMNYMGRYAEETEDWTGAVVVDPSGGAYSGNYYLDIQYLNDLDAGAYIRGYGSATESPLKWFRLPCVDPIPLPILVAAWKEFGDPSYCKPGESLDTALMLENVGNTTLNYVLTIEYDDGSSGWLGASGFSGSVPSGLAGTETGQIHVNQSLMTAYGNYFARLHFEGNDPNNLPFDIPVELIIADTIVSPKFDSVKTSCLGLIVSSNGNSGRDGWGKLNMDYYTAGDCDTTADVYLYECTPLLGWLDGDDTVFTQSMWGEDFVGHGWRPQGGDWAAKLCPEIDADVYHMGTATTQDSTIAMSRIWVAPKSGDCNFILLYTKFWSFDGKAYTGLVIGEGADWDIPWDFPEDDEDQNVWTANTGGFDADRNLVYCQGYEAYGLGSDTLYPYNCQDNDDRFGGMAMIESYLNGGLRSTLAYGGFIEMNDTMLAGAGDGMDPSRLYPRMAVPGFSASDSLNDLNAVLTYEFDFSLGAEDVYEVISVLATVHDGSLTDLQATVDNAAAWFAANGGMDMFVDADVNGQIDVCAGCCYNPNFGHFYNHEGEFNILDIDNFIEWLLRDPGGPPIYDCKQQVDVSGATAGVPDESVDILDIDFMISYLLRGTVPDLGSCP
ncbi:MAG: hypothetical protein JSV52_12150 [Candidatus Zixiibacteriota bacterium]|nr:MAG: hypothetical protein JSV52_12150 [candidate division Zixibacteria bacterium]